MNDTDTTSLEEFWEEMYGARDRVWTGKPNELLVREVADLPPGTALDIGCGEGGDAVWLARRGWRVTGVDLSRTALDRAARHAAEAGVGDRVRWERHELGVSFPEGAFDLVSAFFLHSPVDIPREDILRRAADAVAVGGTLLVVGHAKGPSWAEHDHEVHLPTTEEVLAALAPDPEHWRVERAETHIREVTGPQGQSGTRADNLVRLSRTGTPVG